MSTKTINLDEKDVHFVEHVISIVCNVGNFVKITKKFDPGEWSNEQRAIFRKRRRV